MKQILHEEKVKSVFTFLRILKKQLSTEEYRHFKTTEELNALHINNHTFFVQALVNKSIVCKAKAKSVPGKRGAQQTILKLGYDFNPTTELAEEIIKSASQLKSADDANRNEQERLKKFVRVKPEQKNREEEKPLAPIPNNPPLTATVLNDTVKIPVILRGERKYVTIPSKLTKKEWEDMIEQVMDYYNVVSQYIS